MRRKEDASSRLTVGTPRGGGEIEVEEEKERDGEERHGGGGVVRQAYIHRNEGSSLVVRCFCFACTGAPGCVLTNMSMLMRSSVLSANGSASTLSSPLMEL